MGGGEAVSVQIKVSPAKQQRWDLCLLWQVLRMQRLCNHKIISERLLAKTINYTGLWASTLPSVCCTGGAEIKMNLKTEGDENSCFPFPSLSPVKAMYRKKKLLFI